MLITNIGRLVTMLSGPGREGPIGVILRAAVVLRGDRIEWVGPEAELPRDAEHLRSTAIDAGGRAVLPGLVDSHTHLIFAGSRATEFVQRARGVSYQAIAEAGGGILSTVAATRAATEEQLFELGRARVAEAMRHGTTTLEIKSGYGLDLATELKILRVVRQLQVDTPIQLVPTFMGAHTVPAEWRTDRARYLALLCEEMLPAVAEAKLAVFCDIFVEAGAFTPAEARTIAAAAARAGLGLKLHVDQFHDGHGGALAAELGAVSADHLEYVNAEGMAAMAQAGVVAGILPGATIIANPHQHPPVAALREAGVPMAIATDFNPGTSPTLDLPLCGTIAVTLLGLDPDLVLLGMTRVGAQALKLAEHVGTIEPGRRADLLILRGESEYDPLYRFGADPVRTMICGGDVVGE
ncbi:MAG: imidazolonepropionase [Deltaproteobacteria bacterium]|nr:imidazolonepropionase [Deltaproteobacteria bacterium]